MKLRICLKNFGSGDEADTLMNKVGLWTTEKSTVNPGNISDAFNIFMTINMQTPQ